MNLHSPSLTRVAATLAFASLAGGASAATDYAEGWNDGSTAQWTANTIDSTVAQNGAGGNPDGYLASHGPAPGTFPIGARTEVAAATGDFSGFLWTASFDARQFTGIPTDLALRFRFQDPGFNGWRYDFADLPVANGWKNYSVAFDPSWSNAQAVGNGWRTDLPGGAGSVSWQQNMMNVFSTEVRLDTGTNSLLGIDNFKLVSRPVPEPSTYALFAAGLIGIGALARRRKA